jgi:hypothetical protein
VLRGLRSSAPPKASSVGTYKIGAGGGHLAKADPSPEAPPCQLESGTGSLDDKDCVWLDVSFYLPEAKCRVYQRQLAVFSRPGNLLVLTLTSAQADLDRLALQFGFSP